MVAEARIVRLKTSRGTYIYPRPDAVVSQRQEPYSWKVTNHDGGVAFQATSGDTNMYMAADPGIGAGVFVRHTLAGWEKWNVVDGIMKSFHGTNLSAGTEGITLTSDNTGKETITIYEELCKEDTVVYLKTFHGTYMHVAEEGVIKHGYNKTGWIIVKGNGAQVSLQMTEGDMKINMYLSADPGTWEKVHVRHTLQGWEQWILENSDNNGIFLKSYHGTYVSCDENNNKVSLGPSAKGWETLTPVSADGAPVTDFLSMALQEHDESAIPQVSEYEDFFDFSIMKNDKGDAFISYENKMYKHLKPNNDKVRQMALQSTGTCYFFAAMNVLVNELEFLTPFLAFLKSQIAANPYSRKPGETAHQANERRFGKGSNVDITISRDAFVPSKNNMNKILNDFGGNKDLYIWSRNVIMYYMITGTMQHQRSKEYDSQAAIIMEDWSKMHMESNKYKQALQSVGNGGWPTKAMYDILRLSGIEVIATNCALSGRWTCKGGLLARIPGYDACLCMGQRFLTDHGKVEVPEDASSTGIYCQEFKGVISGTNSHAMAYVRDLSNSVQIIDSNFGGTSTLQQVHEKYYSRIGKPTGFFFCPAYTCKIPSSDFKTLVPRIQYGGGDDDIDLIRSQSLLLMPDHAETVMTCTDDSCTMDDELKAALMVVSSFVEDDTEPQQGGGYSLCWAALSAVIIGMAVLQG